LLERFGDPLESRRNKAFHRHAFWHRSIFRQRPVRFLGRLSAQTC
jgi:hypothetical protein